MPRARDLLAEFKARGYFVAAARADMMSALPNRKFVGIYADSHLDYVANRKPTQPTLAEMTTKSIELLAKNPNRTQSCA